MSNIARLDQALTAADDVSVDDGSLEWEKAQTRLLVVVAGIRAAAQQGRGIGGKTGPKMFEVMMTSADRLEKRANQIGKGSGALTNSAKAIRNANKARQAMETDPDLKPLSQEPYNAPPGNDFSDSELRRQERLHNQGQAQLVAEREAKREARAAEIANAFEEDYSEPIQIMKDIYGYQDPPVPPPADDTPFTPTGPGANTGAGSNTDSGIRGPGKDPGTTNPPPPIVTPPPVDEGPGLIPTGPPTEPPPTHYPPVGPPIDNGPEVTPTPPVVDYPRPDVPGSDVAIDAPSTSSPGGLPPGVLGGIGAGVVGGATIAAGARGLGGLNSLVNQLSSRGAASIGSSATRGAVPGNLSRSAVAGTGSPTSRGATTGAKGAGGGLRSGAGTAAGRSAGGRGAAGAGGAGGRGSGGRGAGGRGAGGMAAGRGGRRKQDEEDRRNDPGFADADEWIDDDGAPPVLS